MNFLFFQSTHSFLFLLRLPSILSFFFYCSSYFFNVVALAVVFSFLAFVLFSSQMFLFPSVVVLVAFFFCYCFAGLIFIVYCFCVFVPVKLFLFRSCDIILLFLFFMCVMLLFVCLFASTFIIFNVIVFCSFTCFVLLYLFPWGGL